MNGFRHWLMNALRAGLQAYTRMIPFARGRGLFIRPIEALKRRGWPAPAIPAGHDLTMEFEPSLLGWTLFERGEWEPSQTQHFLATIQPGDVVMNIGANTGYYALLAAKKSGPDGRVHAFEIQPEIIATLKRNIRRNGLEHRVTVVEAGCYSKEGFATIENRGDPGSARVRPDGQGVQVPLITLDGYVTAQAIERLDVILIDAEGADFEILKGAASTLRRFKPVVMAEVHHLSAFGGSEPELEAFMTNLGYRGRPLRGEFSRDVLFEPQSRSLERVP